MQNFVNNWAAEVTLSPDASSLPVSLPDGTYRLTLSDALGQDATRWEIVEAVVSGGAAALTRGIEGTDAQDWPAGSVAYVAVTAGALNELQEKADEALGKANDALQAGGLSGYGPPTVVPPRVGAVYCDLETFDIYIGGKTDYVEDWAGPFVIQGRAAYVEMLYPQSVDLPKSAGRVVARRHFPEDDPGDFDLILPALGNSSVISFTVSAQADAGSSLVISRPPGTSMIFSESGPSLGATFSQGSARIPMQRMELLVTYCVNGFGAGVLHVLTQHLEP